MLRSGVVRPGERARVVNLLTGFKALDQEFAIYKAALHSLLKSHSTFVSNLTCSNFTSECKSTKKSQKQQKKNKHICDFRTVDAKPITYQTSQRRKKRVIVKRSKAKNIEAVKQFAAIRIVQIQNRKPPDFTGIYSGCAHTPPKPGERITQRETQAGLQERATVGGGVSRTFPR